MNNLVLKNKKYLKSIISYKNRVVILFFVCFFFIENSKAQEVRQFSVLPHNYNIGFAGISKCKNINLSNNIHPLNLNQFFYSNTLIYEGYQPKLSGGILIKFNNQTYPDNVFSHQKFSFGYSYHLMLNNKYRISFGLETQFYTEKFSTDKLIFSKMINLWNNNLLLSTENILPYTSKQISFNTGLVFWAKDFYLSTSVNNFLPIYLQEPKKSIVLITLFSERKNIKLNQSLFLKLNSAFFYSNYNITSYNGFVLNIFNTSIGVASIQNIMMKSLSNGVQLFFGIEYNKILIGFSNEFYYSGFYSTINTNSELSLKFQLNCNQNKTDYTIKCPAYQL